MSRHLKVNNEPITPTELEFLRQLVLRDSRFMIVGMVSAILQGADSGTKDIDLWFETTSDGKLAEAARSLGGVFIWRADPPCLGGEGLERFDVVNYLHGLTSFADEYHDALEMPIYDFSVKILPLERVIASKQAANRAKDKAALPALMAALASLRHIR
jgi:hypothetical protein